MIGELLGSKPVFTITRLEDDHDTIFNPSSLNPKNQLTTMGWGKKTLTWPLKISQDYEKYILMNFDG